MSWFDEVWGYEAIPDLGRLYARKLDSVSFLRIRNWEALVVPNYDTINAQVFKNKEVYIVNFNYVKLQ